MAAPRKNPPPNAIEDIERLAAQGYSVIGIAKHLGVSKHTFKRWCEENESILEAFEVGRETERQALHALIVQSAVLNKPANANAMFLLKCRHGYREVDSPNSKKVDVNVQIEQPVLIVKDHGTDEEWQAKALAQQKALTLDAATIVAVPMLPIGKPAILPDPVAAAYYGPPVMSWESHGAETIPNTPTAVPVAPIAPPVWKQNA